MLINSKNVNENLIISTALKNPRNQIVIMWIPAHVGILGNEKADEIAKKMVLTQQENTIKNLIPIEDVNKIIKCEIFKLWKNEYNQLSQTKGKINREINNNELPKVRWYETIRNIKTTHIKIINRLRTNHSFNKNYKFMIKMEDNPNCEVCNEIEDNEHIILKCKKYDNTRIKYPILNNSTNLIEILKNNIPTQIKSLINFITESNINI